LCDNCICVLSCWLSSPILCCLVDWALSHLCVILLIERCLICVLSCWLSAVSFVCYLVHWSLSHLCVVLLIECCFICVLSCWLSAADLLCCLVVMLLPQGKPPLVIWNKSYK
jgi:hypothetical protein